jgi:hypothetical protein
VPAGRATAGRWPALGGPASGHRHDPPAQRPERHRDKLEVGMPNGMPMMVRTWATPAGAWASASHHPIRTTHSTLATPEAAPCGRFRDQRTAKRPQRYRAAGGGAALAGELGLEHRSVEPAADGALTPEVVERARAVRLFRQAALRVGRAVRPGAPEPRARRLATTAAAGAATGGRAYRKVWLGAEETGRFTPGDARHSHPHPA